MNYRKAQVLAILGWIIATLSTFGQGTIIFNNRAGLVDAPIRRQNGTGAGAGITAQLFLVQERGALLPLFPTTTFRTTSAAAAFYVNQVIVSVPGIPAGSPATVRMRAWDGPSYESTSIRGESGDIIIPQLGGLPPGGGPPITDPTLLGLQSFILGFPEPSPLALGLLGAMILLARRR